MLENELEELKSRQDAGEEQRSSEVVEVQEPANLTEDNAEQ